jgi:hypothetical protein
MKEWKYVNPLYVLLVVAGVVFAITAFAYGVMTVKMLDPDQARAIRREGTGLMHFMDVHGFRLLMIELVILATATVGAIATDSWWRKRT